MSPSKKANKPHRPEQRKEALERTLRSSERSSRVAPNHKEKSVIPDHATAGAVDPPRRTTSVTIALRILALLAVIAITIYVYSIRSRVEQFSAFGYPGIFLIALLANATVLLPAPGVAIVYAMGAIFNPIGVGIAAGTGGAIGELSGYLAGFSGQTLVENSKVYRRVTPWIDKYGAWAILVLAAFPNPFFDTAGIAAGVAKMPVLRFLVFCWVGQLIKMTLFAVAGYYSIEWISNLITR